MQEQIERSLERLQFCVTFSYGGKEIGNIRLVTADAVAKAKYSDALFSVWKQYFGR